MKMPSVPRLRGVSGVGRIKRIPAIQPPPVARIESPTAEMEPRIKRAYYSLCGEQEERARLANRLARELRNYPAITLPEAIMMQLLEDRHLAYSYQSAFDGGRQELGGLVVDFVVLQAGTAIAVLVNGDYWHSLPAQRERDLETKEQVLGQEFQGNVITHGLEIWESTLLGCNRERAVELLLVGIEVGREF